MTMGDKKGTRAGEGRGRDGKRRHGREGIGGCERECKGYRTVEVGKRQWRRVTQKKGWYRGGA